MFGVRYREQQSIHFPLGTCIICMLYRRYLSLSSTGWVITRGRSLSKLAQQLSTRTAIQSLNTLGVFHKYYLLLRKHTEDRHALRMRT